MQYFINKKEKNIHRSKNSNITRGENCYEKKKKSEAEAEGRSFNKFPLLVSFILPLFSFQIISKIKYFSILSRDNFLDNWLYKIIFYKEEHFLFYDLKSKRKTVLLSHDFSWVSASRH